MNRGWTEAVDASRPRGRSLASNVASVSTATYGRQWRGNIGMRKL